jgi:hypothetical protein
MGSCLLGSCLVQVKRETDLKNEKYELVVNASILFREGLLNYQIIEQ